MAEWQPYLQSIIIGFIFSFLLAKLFSIIFAFRDDNLRIARADSAESLDSVDESESSAEIPRVLEEEKLIGEEERERVRYEKDTSSDDDWEGVESTELDEAFSAATAFVATTAADRSVSSKVSNDLQLQLYAFYKIATEGPCSTPQPSAIKMTARAKWQAWKKLGAMPPEEAMQKYIAIVTELFPTWLDGAPVKRRSEGGNDTQHMDSKGPMGPVFSSHVYEEESANDLKMDAIHNFAREGELDNLIKCIENGVSVDLKDSEGRTALHWAVDRGHLNITEALVKEKADINAKVICPLVQFYYCKYIDF